MDVIIGRPSHSKWRLVGKFVTSLLQAANDLSGTVTTNGGALGFKVNNGTTGSGRRIYSYAVTFVVHRRWWTSPNVAAVQLLTSGIW
jgi:hypothetical protein